MKVGFNQHFLIQGCEIINYLLEKSRVVSQSLNERNYHIFYQLIAGADGPMKQRLYLRTPQEYHYLNQSECYRIQGVDDQQEFKEVVEAMKTLQFSNSTMESMFKIVAGILLLGNITFEPLPGNTDAAIVSQTSSETLHQCAELLGLDLDIFLFALQEKRVQMGRGSIVSMKFNAGQAIDNRDTLAKYLYSNMFDWTIQRVNSTLKTEESNFSIGILDIFGFEVFELNSFEQLCINYANEKLQFHFNEVIFHEEKMMYQDEGISLDEIAFEDNSECVNLIEGKPYGLISLLEEECSLGNGTDLSYASKIEKTFVATKSTSNKFFIKNKVKPECFSVVHFAGPVEYNVTNFLDKNRDTLNQTVKEAMILSKIPLIADLFTDKDADGAPLAPSGGPSRGGSSSKNDKKQSKSTLGGQFRNQLIGLITNLRLTEPHFIRCIKPNHQKVGGILDGHLALRQLKYAGLFEAIRIRKSGFAYRSNFIQFANTYQILIDGLMLKRNKRSINDRESCELILSTLTRQGLLTSSMWRVGTKTKVFLKNNSDRLLLEKEKSGRIVTYVMKLQKFIRSFLTRLFYQKELLVLKREKMKIEDAKRKQIAAVITIQKYWRRKLVINNMKSMKYLIELRKIIKRREIYKIKDILVKIDEEMKILKQREEQFIQLQQKKEAGLALLHATSKAGIITNNTTTGGGKSSQPTPMEMRQILASAKKINKAKIDPLTLTPAPTSAHQSSSSGWNNPVSTILSIFEHEIKIAKIMYKLFNIQETLISDLNTAIQKNNILQLNSLILKSERLEMNNHPIVLEAKELIITLYHKRKIIQQLIKFLINHQNEFNEKEIEYYLEEGKKLNINPDFINKIQLIYDNAGPRLKTRNRLRMNIEMIDRYGIEQSILEVLQIRTHHEAFAESELRAARQLLQLLEYDQILFPSTSSLSSPSSSPRGKGGNDDGERLVDVNDLHDDAVTTNAKNNVPFADKKTSSRSLDKASTDSSSKPTLLWGKPILTETTGPLLTLEVIEICNAITESTYPAIVKMHKQRLQNLAGSVDRVYQIIRYYKWMKVLCTWKYPEVIRANSQKAASDAGKKGATAVFDAKDSPAAGVTTGGGFADDQEEFFGLRFQEAHCNPYVIRLLHQDFDIYGQRNTSAMMEAALSAIDLPSSMQETLENLDLLNDIDKPILLPNGNIYQKTINNKNYKLFTTNSININSNIQNNLLKTISPNKTTINQDKQLMKTEKLLSTSYKQVTGGSFTSNGSGGVTPKKRTDFDSSVKKSVTMSSGKKVSGSATITTPGRVNFSTPASKEKELVKKFQNVRKSIYLLLLYNHSLSLDV